MLVVKDNKITHGENILSLITNNKSYLDSQTNIILNKQCWSSKAKSKDLKDGTKYQSRPVILNQFYLSPPFHFLVFKMTKNIASSLWLYVEYPSNNFLVAALALLHNLIYFIQQLGHWLQQLSFFKYTDYFCLVAS